MKEKRPPATEGYSNLNDDGYHRELTQVIPTKTEEEEESYHFQQAGKKDGLIRTNTSTAKEGTLSSLREIPPLNVRYKHRNASLFYVCTYV